VALIQEKPCQWLAGFSFSDQNWPTNHQLIHLVPPSFFEFMKALLGRPTLPVAPQKQD
jgi:hypothetical protein